MDFPELVLKANTRSLGEAEDDMDRLVRVGDRTERAIEDQSDGMSQSYDDFASTAGKALGGVVTAIASYQSAAAALGQATDFDAALSETSTLIDGTAAEMEMLSESAKSLAYDFGTDATVQVEAFYQAISAGAGDVAQSAILLDDANELAEGGITSVTTAVGILTGVVNTYGREVITSAQVSDTLFVGMRAGVTTIDQLSGSIGGVLPLANAMGLSFEETVAAVAALTKNNLTTAASVTSLNAALTAVSGPTEQAQKLAASLGLEFNAAALEAKGFGAFMADVSEKTGGSVEAMRTLFGSVEGMKAALLFAGEAGGQYSDIMVDMAQKLGQTDIAVEKINDSLSDRLDDSMARLKLTSLEFGEALLTVAVPAMEAAVVATGFLAENVDVLLPPLIALGVAVALPLAISGATSLVAMAGAAATATVSFGAATASIFAATTATGALSVAAAVLITPLSSLIAVTAAASAAFYLMRDSSDQAEIAATSQAEALGSLDEALVSVNASGAAGEAQARQIAAEHFNAAIAVAEHARQQAQLTLSMQREAQETSNPFDGPGLSALREARDNLAAANAAVDALRERMAEFGATTNEAGEVIDENTGRVVRTTAEVQRLHAAQLQFMADDQARSAEALAEANEILASYRDQAEMQQLIALYGEDSVQVAQERAARERDVVSEQLRGLDVADSLKAEILAAVDATYQSEAATSAWAARMSSVSAQISAIANALGQMGSSAINTAANHAEIAALEAGASVQEASHQRTMEQIKLETEARAMGAQNELERQIILQDGAQKLAELESDAALTAARAAATERDAAAAGSGRRSGGASEPKLSESQKEHNELMEEGQRLTNSLMTAQEEYADALDHADDLLDAGAISMETYIEHVGNLREELAESEFSGLISGVEDVAGSMLDAAFAADSYKDVLGNMAEAGVDALADLAAQMLKNYIMQQLLNSISGGSTGGGGGGSGIVGALFGGARAVGGDMDPGKNYLVGEEGPEIIKAVSGQTVIPNSKIGPASDRQSMTPQMQAAPNVNVTSAPADVVVLDDPRKIDEYRMTPNGERARQRANRRAGS